MMGGEGDRERHPPDGENNGDGRPGDQERNPGEAADSKHQVVTRHTKNSIRWTRAGVTARSVTHVIGYATTLLNAVEAVRSLTL